MITHAGTHERSRKVRSHLVTQQSLHERRQGHRLLVAMGWILLASITGAGCSELSPSITGKAPKDLLKLIDLDKDSVKGSWTLDDGGLKSPGASFSRVQIPYVPGDEYNVKLVAQRMLGTDMIALGLVKGGVQFVVGIDGSNKYVASGIDRIDNKPFSENETAVKRTILSNDKASTIEVQVRNESIVVNVDGTKIVDWRGDFKRLSLFKEWKVPLGNALFVGTFTQYTISTLELTNLTKGGSYLR
jgi:hypothetical protein